jgi:hypothetical protein
VCLVGEWARVEEIHSWIDDGLETLRALNRAEMRLGRMMSREGREEVDSVHDGYHRLPASFRMRCE